MRSGTWGIQISLAVHGLFFALLALIGMPPAPVKKPIVIDFTVLEPSHRSERIGRPGATTPQGRSAAAPKETKPSVREKGASAAPAATRAEAPAPVASPQPVPPQPAAVSSAAATAPRAEAPNGREAMGSGSAQPAGRGEQGPRTSGGEGRASGAGEAAESAKKRYLAEHFAYIRDLIMKNQAYPAMARKMGWEGTAVVSFVVCENGSVEGLMIKHSSGFALLDKNAMETVRKACPLPKPPVRAELVIPIAYRLR